MFTQLLEREPVRRVLGSRAVALATAPHGVDRYLDQLRPTWAGDEVRATVVDVEHETSDVVTLTLRPGRGWKPGQGGQHVSIGVEIDGRRHTRSFSIASSAYRADGLFQVTVKANPDGIVSRHLVTHARAGLTVTLSDPAGDFTLPTERPDRLLLISGGSGITPVMSLLRTLLDEGHRGQVTFLHYARTVDHVIFADEVGAVADDHPNVAVHIVTTREPSRAGELTGRFGVDHVELVAADLRTVETYACGPVGLVDAVLDHWEAAGATERLHVERFQPAPSAASPTSDAPGGEVRYAASDLTVTSDGRTLLEQAESAGLNPAFGCRMGVCHTCTRRKVSGIVRDARTGTLSASSEQPIQICVATPISDIVVDL